MFTKKFKTKSLLFTVLGTAILSLPTQAQFTTAGNTTFTNSPQVRIDAPNPFLTIEEHVGQFFRQNWGINFTSAQSNITNTLSATYAGPNAFNFSLRNGQTRLGIQGDMVQLGNFSGPDLGQDVSANRTYVTQLAIGGRFANGCNLSVVGKSIFEEVEVRLQNAWPDYVFQNSYNLTPLSEVESFITKNSHLPNVPSASEVEKDGINLAKMDAVLLRKIEELTLYLIDLEKKNNALEAKLNQL